MISILNFLKLKTYNSSQLSLYNDLLQKISVEFEDGFKLD
jgi:hypothetical protein